MSDCRFGVSPVNPDPDPEYRFEGLLVISYPSHFVPTLVISYLRFGHFVPSNNHFVPRSFRTHFGHFIPRSTGYDMVGDSYPSHFVPILVIWYPFLVISCPAKMDGRTDGRTDALTTDGQECFDRNNKLTSYS